MFKRVQILSFLIIGLSSGANAQTAPGWVFDKEKIFPDREWLCVVESARDRQSAQSAAINALARVFKTDVSGITVAFQQFSQVLNDDGGRKAAAFHESKDFTQEVVTGTNVTGLIGVQTDVWTANDGRVYANARMNRRQCSNRYSAIINENLALIRSLKEEAVLFPGTFDAYEALNFAADVALVTDNFRNILSVLDPDTAGQSFDYGNADTVKTLALNAARSIVITIKVEGDVSNRITRAFTSFFSARGFRTNTSGTGSYLLYAELELEDINPGNQRNYFSRYILNVSVENKDGTEVFSYSGNGRQGHLTQSEARQRAVRAAEGSIGGAEFAEEFNRYLESLLQ